MRQVIIGNSAAAIGAVEGIRKVNSTDNITVISTEPYHTYSRPLISYYLSGKVSAENMIYRELDFYENNQVDTILGVKAVNVDTAAKVVALENGKKVPYDKLLIATGGKPFVPPMEGLDKKNIYSFIKMDDVKEIEKVAQPGKKCVIIGAGLIGLKAAEGLAKLGVEITVVELANRVLSAILDEEAATIVQKELESHGITFNLNTTVEQINGGEYVSGVNLKNGKTVDCDFLVVAIGVTPNTDVVSHTAVKVNRGIVVEDTMQTSVQEIYAAGDVAEGYDMLFDAQRVLPILPNAYKQGEVAGKNMAGCETHHAGGFAMNSIGFFDLPMITAGVIKPDSNEFEQIGQIDEQAKSYKKIICKGNQLVGFIALNQVERAGILTSLISEKVDITPFKHKLLAPDFGYIHLPKELRQQRMLKGGQKV